MGTFGELDGNKKRENFPSPPTPTPKIKERKKKNPFQAFHWMYEISISKIGHHHFQPRLIPLLQIGGIHWN
jgi:hypothetical protein